MPPGKKRRSPHIPARRQRAEKISGRENQFSRGPPESDKGRFFRLFKMRTLAIFRKTFIDRRRALRTQRIRGNSIDNISAFLTQKCAFFRYSRGDASHGIMVHLPLAKVRCGGRWRE